jgi:hypothetical protein
MYVMIAGACFWRPRRAVCVQPVGTAKKTSQTSPAAHATCFVLRSRTITVVRVACDVSGACGDQKLRKAAKVQGYTNQSSKSGSKAPEKQQNATGTLFVSENAGLSQALVAQALSMREPSVQANHGTTSCTKKTEQSGCSFCEGSFCSTRNFLKPPHKHQSMLSKNILRRLYDTFSRAHVGTLQAWGVELSKSGAWTRKLRGERSRNQA